MVEAVRTRLGGIDKLWAIAVVWFAILCFVPMLHVAPGESTTIPALRLFQRWVPLIPFILILPLLLYETNQTSRLWRLFSYKVWAKIAYISLAVVIGLMVIENIASWPELTWSGFTTVGSLAIVFLLIARKLRPMGDVRAVSLAIMGCLFVIGLWETIYHTTGYLFPYSQWHLSIGNLQTTLPKQIFMFLPLCIMFFYYKGRISRKTLASLGVFVAMMVVWLTVGQRWSVVFYDLEQAKWIGHEPVNWPIYQMVKAMKIPLLMGVLSLNYTKYRKIGDADES